MSGQQLLPICRTCHLNPCCLTSRRSQPPLARSVPLSRFTSPVGGGSAFFVRPLRTMQIIPTSGNEHRSLLLISFKTYAVLAPFLLVALMNTRLQSIWVVHVICFFCFRSEEHTSELQSLR